MLKEVVIFDVCNTLYNSNTTFEFINFALEKKRPGKKTAFDLLTKKFSFFFIGWTLLGKATKQDIIRTKALGLLKGINRQELYELAEEFYHSYLSHKQMDDTIQMLKEAIGEHEVWLFSNSIEPVIYAIAKNLNCHYEATELEYNNNNVFTGRIKRDLSGKKNEAFVNRFGKEATIKMMCSDNKSDLEILKLAKKPVVIIYKASDRAFWKSLNPMFIEKF